MKSSLITGVTGQDGSYLAEHLLGLGYRVAGLARAAARDGAGRGDAAASDEQPIPPGVDVVHGDLLDGESLLRAVRVSQPDEVYNLAAITFVPSSFGQAELVGEVTGVGAVRLLDAVRQVQDETGKPIRVCQASSAEMFGHIDTSPQSERTPFRPRSPYGVAKLNAHLAVGHYRARHGLHASAAILFNHESPRRGAQFVTRKITRAAARIKLGRERELLLGNLDARRDWGFAGDYVRVMHLMLQQDEPTDYVIGTGEAHSIREFLDVAFGHLGLDWREYVRVDERFYRPAEPVDLTADASQARRVLGWAPTVSFAELVTLMVESDLALEQQRAD